MREKVMKYENPIRLNELDPKNTLKRIGLLNSHVICDIGAGSGIFTIPAAKLTDKKVYALEIDDEMMSILAEKVKTESLENVELIKVKDDSFALDNKSVDIVLIVTVLHEISKKEIFLKEVKRILADSGRVAVIEFHKIQTPMGPPVINRISKDEADSEFESVGFQKYDEFDLGDNYYCRMFKSV